MKPNWPKISTVMKNGKSPTVMVDARIDGKGTRKFFHTKCEAGDGRNFNAHIGRTKGTGNLKSWLFTD